jgi:hypothetical protein
MRWKCTAPATRRGGMGTIGTGTGTYLAAKAASNEVSYLAAKAAANEVEVHSSGHQEGGNGQPVRSDAAIG